jgi:hypothetical protein
MPCCCEEADKPKEECKHEYDLECDNKALVCRKCKKFRPTTPPHT